MPRTSLVSLTVLSLLLCGCGGTDDAAAQATENRAEARQYAVDPIACTQDSDCCVVIDGCMGTGLLVAQKDQATVASLISAAGHVSCNKCMTPLVQPTCAAGACVGTELHCTGPSEGLGINHCGAVAAPADCQPTAAVDAGAKQTLAVFGCGT